MQVLARRRTSRPDPRSPVRRLLIAVAATMVMGAALAPGAASAQAPDPVLRFPYYVRDLPGTEWTAFVFYRSPGCVRADFNLLAFFDPPAAFACTLTVEGFAIADGPGPPRHQKLTGLGAVPIWFVRTAVVEDAAADGVLTIGELRGLDPLIGSASSFMEVLHPEPTAKNPKLVLNAAGTLQDGRSFRLHATWNGKLDRYKVRVAFGG